MSKPMEVQIYVCRFEEDPAYQGSTFSLSVHQEAVKDAFQGTRLKEGKPYFLDCGGYWPGFTESVLERCNHTLGELNLLVCKLSQTTERQIETYKGVLKVSPERNVKQVINGLYNLEWFESLLRTRCDGDIGEMTIENDLDSLSERSPEGIYPLSDTGKAEAYVREMENGVFISGGYCYRVSDQWQEVYDGKQLSEQVELYQSRFSLYFIPKGTEPENLSVGVWLGLSYNEASKIQILENLGLESFKYCRIVKVHTVAPLFEQLTRQDNGIDRQNDFAGKLFPMTEKELLKYEAVAEYERCPSLEQAAEPTDRLGQYVLDPVQVARATYGRKCPE